jgi:hypothetical protein
VEGMRGFELGQRNMGIAGVRVVYMKKRKYLWQD